MSICSRAVVTASLVFSLGLTGIPVVAVAEESAPAATTLDEAWTKYGELSMQVAETGESLNDTYYELEQAEAQKSSLEEQIVQTTAHLEEAKHVLGDRVAANYKAGTTSLIDLILGTESIEELVSAFHLIDRITEGDIASVNDVKNTENRLQQQKTNLQKTQDELRKLATQKEKALEDLKNSLGAQQSYIASLSEPLRAAFDEKQVTEIVEQQAKAVQALAEQEAKLASGNASAQGVNGSTVDATSAASAANAANAANAQSATSVTDGASIASAVTTIAQETAAATGVTETTTTGDTSSSASTLSSDSRAKILEAAYSQIGVTYEYGASSPGEAFDCSGLTSWAYEQAGIEIPHSSAAQAEMASSVSESELQPGDLVFYIGNVDASQSGNHVAIYAGDGQVIHANGSSVVVSDMNENYTSAGSIGLSE